jgi:hypothetical protein
LLRKGQRPGGGVTVVTVVSRQRLVVLRLPSLS